MPTTTDPEVTLEANILCLERGLCWSCHIPLREVEGWLLCDGDDCGRQFLVSDAFLKERLPVPAHLRGKEIPAGDCGADIILAAEGSVVVWSDRPTPIPLTAVFMQSVMRRTPESV